MMHSTAISTSACVTVRRVALLASPCHVGARQYHSADGGRGNSAGFGSPPSPASPHDGRRGALRGRAPAERPELWRARGGGALAGARDCDVLSTSRGAEASTAAAVAPRLLSLAQQRHAAAEALCAAPAFGGASHDASHSLRPDAACQASPKGLAYAHVFQNAAATAQMWLATRASDSGEISCDPQDVPARPSCSTGNGNISSSSTGARMTSAVTAQQRSFASTSSADAASTASPDNNTTTATTQDGDETPQGTASTTAAQDTHATSTSSSDAEEASTAQKMNEEQRTEDPVVQPSPTFRSMCEACKLLGLLHPGGAARGDWDRAELKHIYRSLAQRFHPDVAGGDARSMEQINQAYDLLEGLTPQEKLSFEVWITEGGEAALAIEDAMQDGSGQPSTAAVVGDYMAVSGASTIASVLLFAYYYVFHMVPAAKQRRLAEEAAEAERAAAAAAAAAAQTRKGFYRRRPTTSTTTTAAAAAPTQSALASAAPRTIGQRVDMWLAHPLVVSLLAWVRQYGTVALIAVVACMNGVLLRQAVTRRLLRP